MAYFDHFEINIISALSAQLLEKLKQLEPAPLDPEYLNALASGQGIYQLYHQQNLVYVGKANSLKKRLNEHRDKIRGRQRIDVSEMSFTCLYVHANWTALAPEESLIRHYKASGEGGCAWNGNGFGPHDPGRDRESTDKPTEGFDAKYPIRGDWPCDWIHKGSHDVFELLSSLKRELPFLLRFEMAAKKSRSPHDAFSGLRVEVLEDGMSATELLVLVAKALPGWQATAFPSHLILYEEKRPYKHGKRLWPV